MEARIKDWVYDYDEESLFELPRNRGDLRVIHDPVQWEPGTIYLPRCFMVVRAKTKEGARQKIEEFLEGTWRERKVAV